jgi:hypothetical protein
MQGVETFATSTIGSSPIPAIAAAVPATALPAPLSVTPSSTVAAPVIGQRTETSACVASGGLSDPTCTLGVTLRVTAAQICA